MTLQIRRNALYSLNTHLILPAKKRVRYNVQKHTPTNRKNGSRILNEHEKYENIALILNLSEIDAREAIVSTGSLPLRWSSHGCMAPRCTKCDIWIRFDNHTALRGFQHVYLALEVTGVSQHRALECVFVRMY